MTTIQILADILFFIVFGELAIALTFYLFVILRDMYRIKRTDAKKHRHESYKKTTRHDIL